MIRPESHGEQMAQQEFLHDAQNHGTVLMRLYSRVERLVDEKCVLTGYSLGDNDSVREYEQTYKESLGPQRKARLYTELDIDRLVIDEPSHSAEVCERFNVWLWQTDKDDDFLGQDEFVLEKLGTGKLRLQGRMHIDDVVEGLRSGSKVLAERAMWRYLSTYEARQLHARLGRLLLLKPRKPRQDVKMV